MDIINNLDSSFLFYIQENFRNDFFTNIFLFFTKLGDYGIIWFFIIGILLIKKEKTIAIKAFLALIISFCLGGIIIKPMVQRLRPFHSLGDLNALVEAFGFSFPSGHTSTSFAVAFILFRELQKKFGVLIIIIASIIAFSRLYLGVHFPTDVLGGIILGGISAILADKIYNIFCMKVK